MCDYLREIPGNHRNNREKVELVQHSTDRYGSFPVVLRELNGTSKQLPAVPKESVSIKTELPTMPGAWKMADGRKQSQVPYG